MINKTGNNFLPKRQKTSSPTAILLEDERETKSLSYVAPSEQAYEAGMKIMARFDVDALKRFMSSGEVIPIQEGTTVLVLETNFLNGRAMVKVTSGTSSGEKGYMPLDHLK
ncbi:hypothetical protein NDK47_08795 [Brevibacillus ruminantium]|uniref:Uncharacterized protein n=1 Tax=Brevibacillus ruminantium TaxID=2950604 RepID=A0ABY4WKR1_9BACL|nr:hypothetical protein [Brevibacillus ruminantium]USG67351.1 hypothetical protein NDK47_08795 [Brevibacillus ruminantium]